MFSFNYLIDLFNSNVLIFLFLLAAHEKIERDKRKQTRDDSAKRGKQSKHKPPDRPNVKTLKIKGHGRFHFWCYQTLHKSFPLGELSYSNRDEGRLKDAGGAEDAGVAYLSSCSPIASQIDVLPFPEPDSLRVIFSTWILS